MERAWDAAGRHAVERPGPQKAPVGVQVLIANDDARRRSLHDISLRLTTVAQEPRMKSGAPQCRSHPGQGNSADSLPTLRGRSRNRKT
jgi:hypothetical protein